MTPADIVRAFAPRTAPERRLWEAAKALLPSEAAPATEFGALDPEALARAVDRFHGATFYIFQSKPVTGYEAQFRVGMAEAIKASRER